MEYTPAQHAFAAFITTGQIHPHADFAPPSEWNHLPAANPNIPEFMLGDTERERYLTMATLLPDSSKDRVIRMVRALDDHQRNIPAAVSRFINICIH